MEKKLKRGGARIGAGRPSKARANYTFYLEPKVVDDAKKLKGDVSLNDYINDSISHFNEFNLKQNKIKIYANN
jgi:hypothetical protein